MESSSLPKDPTNGPGTYVELSRQKSQMDLDNEDLRRIGKQPVLKVNRARSFRVNAKLKPRKAELWAGLYDWLRMFNHDHVGRSPPVPPAYCI